MGDDLHIELDTEEMYRAKRDDPFETCPKCGGEMLIRTETCVSKCSGAPSKWASLRKLKYYVEDVEARRGMSERHKSLEKHNWDEIDLDELFEEFGTLSEVCRQTGIGRAAIKDHMKRDAESSINRF